MDTLLIERIAAEFSVPKSVLATIVRTAPYRYKVYEVPKKSGPGTRTIAQPAKEIKVLQRFLVTKIIDELPVHCVAMAYRKGGGIRKNAERHVKSKFLLKMDFENFFPSIRPRDLKAHMSLYMGEAFSDEDFWTIERICFWRPHKGAELRLSIGGPSSPFISNTILYEFDTIVKTLADRKEVTYTRYADDLTLSTERREQLGGIEMEVKSVTTDIKYPRLSINQKKTLHTSKKYHRRVTGLVLSSQDQVSLGRVRKRNISAMVHRAVHGDLADDRKKTLSGLLAFAFDVEPAFVERMRKKYGHNNVDRILRND